MEEHPILQAEEPQHEITLEQEREVLQREVHKFHQETQVALEIITTIMLEHVILPDQLHLHQM
jgi:hypothetical protein